MWPFKKKEVEPIEKKEKIITPKYKVKEDRFSVIVNKDENNYMVEVYDTWSSIFFVKDGVETGTMHCRSSTMYKVYSYEQVLKQIEENKEYLRLQFIKDRKKQLKTKKKKVKAVK